MCSRARPKNRRQTILNSYVGLQLLVTLLRAKGKTYQLVPVSDQYRNKTFYSHIQPGRISVYQFAESLSYLTTEQMLQELPLGNIIILDFCHVNFIDYTGVAMLKTKLANYKSTYINSVRYGHIF